MGGAGEKDKGNTGQGSKEMKRKMPLVLLFLAAVMLFAGIIQVTGAYFSDPESSTGNELRVITNNWYNTNWNYRKSITITSGAALTNYQLKLTIDTATLVGQGKMRSDGNDIRFTTSDGSTLMDYWIESGMNTASTIIWVEVPSIISGSTTIYMYYGYALATAASNGDATFIFFDSFEVDLSKWTEVSAANGDMTRVSSPAYHGSYSMYLNDTSTGGTYGANAVFTPQMLCVIKYIARPAQTNDIWEIQVLSSGGTIGPRLRFNSDASIEYKTGPWQDFTPAVSYSASTWYRFRLGNANCATDTYDIYIDDSLKNSGTSFDNKTTDCAQIRFVTATASEVPDIYIDLVKVRAYAATEPTYSIGAEED